jgi:hypothetical protein
MEWFRLYSEVLDCPKVQRLPPAVFKTWINLLCIANDQRDRGSIPSVEDIAFRLRMDDDTCNDHVTLLQERGLIEGGRIYNWEKWNPTYQSETPEGWRERKRRQREREKGDVTKSHDVTVTSHERSRDVTTLDKSREEESRQEESKDPLNPPRGKVVWKRPMDGFDAWYERFPRKQGKAKAVEAWRKVPEEVDTDTIMDGLERMLPEYLSRDPDKVPTPAVWLNQKRWEDEPVPVKRPTLLNRMNGNHKPTHMDRAQDMAEYARSLREAGR